MIQKFGNINPKPMKCCYLIGDESKKCDKPTKFKIVLDGDKNKTRDYDELCPEHRTKCGGSH